MALANKVTLSANVLERLIKDRIQARKSSNISLVDVEIYEEYATAFDKRYHVIATFRFKDDDSAFYQECAEAIVPHNILEDAYEDNTVGSFYESLAGQLLDQAIDKFDVHGGAMPSMKIYTVPPNVDVVAIQLNEPAVSHSMVTTKHTQFLETDVIDKDKVVGILKVSSKAELMRKTANDMARFGYVKDFGVVVDYLLSIYDGNVILLRDKNSDFLMAVDPKAVSIHS